MCVCRREENLSSEPKGLVMLEAGCGESKANGFGFHPVSTQQREGGKFPCVATTPAGRQAPRRSGAARRVANQQQKFLKGACRRASGCEWVAGRFGRDQTTWRNSTDDGLLLFDIRDLNVANGTNGSGE